MKPDASASTGALPRASRDPLGKYAAFDSRNSWKETDGLREDASVPNKLHTLLLKRIQ